jgi:DNA topoisomerase II
MSSIEQKYQKLTPIEHCLKRPGMYVGSTSRQLEDMWIFDNKEKRMVKKTVEYTPAFLKIFDEILTNATDHAARDKTLDKIKVDYDTTTGEITVMNTGQGIPVVIHQEHQMYVPELIFGHLLSGSNYDDTQTRTGAGTNGLGSKLVSVFSKKFNVETVDSERGLKFVQEYNDNMSKRTKPKVTKTSVKSYTKITFVPDYVRFHMKSLDEDAIGLLSKRVYDCIACTEPHVSIFLNGEKLKGKGLNDYVKYFFDEEKVKVFHESYVGKHGKEKLVWEYAIVPWDKFEQVSFVNGNSTFQGGRHVDYITNQITGKLKTFLETKKKIKEVKTSMIKERFFLFLRATVVNPAFSSQTKEYMTTQVRDFGCRVDVSDALIAKLQKSSIIDEIVELCRIKESLELSKKTDGNKKSRVVVPKLEDALWAGTSRSEQCTLILTEGDSAKTFAMWGRSVVGCEKWGIWPLKGKVLNLRDATVQQLLNNEEINNIKQILGLKQDKDYKDTKELRYGKLMILTDADHDGSHIKGLIINMFHFWWPSLLKMDFVQTMRTPIVKATKGQRVIEFFNQRDYEVWKESGNTNGYQIKYYKGLGTSRKEDAKASFEKIDELRAEFQYKDENCDKAIVLAFEKDKNVKATKNDGDLKMTDMRKQWLKGYNKDAQVDYTNKRVTYQDFIHKELIHFSIYDNTRSIPSLCDGMKPSQRKILHYMLDKNLVNKTIKVAQLSGYVSAETSYHHGEASLQQAIIGMAQNFVGSNNINLLYPDGNFGSRFSGGKDAASARYIFTRLSDISPLIYHRDDVPLLEYLDDDGQQIEPAWFLPIIPMVLVNGCEGIGTGFSTSIPPHDPKQIIHNLIRLMDGKDPEDMKPYFRGFQGDVVEVEPGSVQTKGHWNRASDTQIRVTELPVGMWVTPYKEFLESCIDTSKKDSAKGKAPAFVLKDVQNLTMDENSGINFLLEFKSKADLDKFINSHNVEKELKLVRSFSTNNMYLFDDNLVPMRYKNVTDILLDFYDIRIEFYEKRKEYLVKKLQKELDILQSKVRFILGVLDGSIEMRNTPKDKVVACLEQMALVKVDGSFDYLVRMPLVSLTKERVEELKRDEENKRNQLVSVKGTSEKEMWKHDLQQVLEALDKQ